MRYFGEMLILDEFRKNFLNFGGFLIIHLREIVGNVTEILRKIFEVFRNRRYFCNILKFCERYEKLKGNFELFLEKFVRKCWISLKNVKIF